MALGIDLSQLNKVVVAVATTTLNGSLQVVHFKWLTSSGLLQVAYFKWLT
jgi:hypothetical protein